LAAVLDIAALISALEQVQDIATLSAIGMAVSARIAALAQGNGKAADNSELLDAKAVCAMLGGVSSSFLYSGRGSKVISAVRLGRRKMYRRSEVEKFIARGGKP